MEEKVYLDKLAKRDIKPTAIRLLILKSMMEAGRAVSQLDLETLLDTVDKSTISRTITLFLSHHLIHSIAQNQKISNNVTESNQAVKPESS